MERYEWRGFRIEITPDTECENPFELRSNEDAPVITYYAGARHVLGNKPITRDEHRATGEKIARGEYIGLPVFAYIHGQVALRTRHWKDIDPDEFDSGQSGFIYLTAETVRKRHGGDIDETLRKSVKTSLKKELTEFAEWLNGECYHIQVFDEEGQEVENSGGYIGLDYAHGVARDAVSGTIERRAMGDEDEDDSAREVPKGTEPDYETLRKVLEPLPPELADWVSGIAQERGLGGGFEEVIQAAESLTPGLVDALAAYEARKAEAK